MDERKPPERITINPEFFRGKPIIRGRRVAVEHTLGVLATGSTAPTILEYYLFLELRTREPISCMHVGSSGTSA